MGQPLREGLSRVSGPALVLLALMFLLLPLRWVLAALLAGAIHELCHYGAVRLLGGKVTAFSVFSSGARMDAAGLGRGKALFCILAGPLGSFSLLLLARWLPRLAICGGIQGAYNLLPIEPLDGGRALRCLMGFWLSPERAEQVAGALETLCMSLLLLIAFYASFVLGLGLLPVLLCILMILKTKSAKNPCKPTRFGVQ